MFESSKEVQVKSFLGEHLVSGDERRYCCPFCHKRGKTADTKFHFYLNLKKMLFVCHRCGAKGSAEKLLDQEAPVVIPQDWYLVLREKILDPRPKISACELTEIEFPEGCSPALQFPRATEYLKSRRLTVEAIQQYDFRYSPYEQRLYCPTYELDSRGRKVLTYWTGRYLGREEFKPRYKNPPLELVSRRDKLFGYNYHQLNPGRDLYLMEGVFSALAAGEEGVASFGKMLTFEQIDKLTRLNPKTLYVCLDGDASREAAELAWTLNRRMSGKIYIVPLPLELDPGDVPDFISYAKKTAIKYDQWGRFQYALLIQGWQNQRTEEVCKEF